MKLLIVLGILCCYGASASPLIQVVEIPNACSHGPSYWCENLRAARECHAVRHCIQTVWEHQELPPDESNVCQICKEMVTEARDQLESNETQEELREVFEGSCKLIPVKVVAKECIQLVDEFIPELVETLASQMNPQVVCAVAGLCNSERIDNLIEEQEIGPFPHIRIRNVCKQYKNLMTSFDKYLERAPQFDVLVPTLKICSRLSSFTDSCRAIIVANFEQIYNRLKSSSSELVHYTGKCSETAPKYEVTAVANKELKDDLPCDFCKQLVVHLKDILIANTTQEEFKQVLEGLCKQTGNFKEECLSLVDQYYLPMYDFLVNDLNPESVCTDVGLCNKPGQLQIDEPVWALLPADAALKVKTIFAASQVQVDEIQSAVEMKPAEKVIGQDEFNSVQMTKIRPAEKVVGQDEASSVQMAKIQPAEMIVGQDEGNSIPMVKMQPAIRIIGKDEANSINMIKLRPSEKQEVVQLTKGTNTEVHQTKFYCTLCEYVLHQLQETLSSASAEEEIKDAVEKVCNYLPDNLRSQCDDFVSTYGDSVIALLVQQIDPSQVCPELGICPGLYGVEMSLPGSDAECTLCEYMVDELDGLLKDNKTEENIRRELDKLCSSLPKNLADDCQNLVDTYSQELVDFILADLTPQEVCVALKLCKVSLDSDTKINEIVSNEIPSNTLENPDAEIIEVAKFQLPETRIMAPKIGKGFCVMCEFIMSQLDGMLKNNSTDEEIKEAVETVCHHLPKTVSDECLAFVEEYGDAVIELLTQVMEPKQICTELGLCNKESIQVSDAVACDTCKGFVELLQKLLEEPEVQQDIDRALEKLCTLVPKDDQKQCHTFVKIYGPTLASLLSEIADAGQVCTALTLCNKKADWKEVLISP